MSNLTRPASYRAGSGRAAPQGYRVVGILIATIAILVGWGQIGTSAAAWPASANMARAATSTYNYPLYACGYNSYGQLGNGTTTDSAIPVPVGLPAGVIPIMVAGGEYHSLAIGNNGKLYAWGNNESGQLGIGSTTNSSSPVTVSLPAGVTPVAIAAGASHNLIIGNNGKLYAWGNNGYGQLGNGTAANSSIPVTISLPGGITPTTVAAGHVHSLAIGNNGKLYAWGDNEAGQLGNGTTTNSSSPVTVSLPAGVTPVAIAAGNSHSLVIGNNGKLYAWGDNAFGELGNSSSILFSSSPVTVSLPAGVGPTAISAGAGALQSLASGNDGKLYAWGDNTYGQLGNGSMYPDSFVPVVVSLPAGVRPVTIVSGGVLSLAIGSDDKLYAWGSNQEGQLCNNIAPYYSSLVPIVAGSVAGITHPLLAAGSNHVLAQLAIPSQIAATSGSNQSAPISTVFASPLVATVRDIANNPISNTVVTFTAPASGASSTFAGGSNIYTGTTNASGIVTATMLTANASIGSYSVKATVSGVSTPASFSLTNRNPCSPLNVTSNQDDGSCGTLRYAVLSLAAPMTSKPKIITIDLSAGSVISLTSGLTLTSGVAITTTAPCGIGAGNTMLPPITIQGTGSNSGVGLTLRGHNQLYGLWVRGFSGVQIKAPVGSFTKMQCVRASKS